MSSRGKYKKEHPRKLARQGQERTPVYVRSFARSIARHSMEVAGVRRINKKYKARGEEKGEPTRSAFARRWRQTGAEQKPQDKRRAIKAARKAKKA